MSGIRIVEYARQYAAGLAKMWNMSADYWGGLQAVETEESVIRDNENSENIKIWVALDGDEVVGYCSFSEYRQDQGASYIPLLNVRPDYHGKKVGKLLVLKAVEEACRHPWPRLDLFTWPGNTKAMPLYKKCGFFWENRDDSTHLMNFMPYVLRTEAVADFFRHADWYADSVREITAEPDGRIENGFEYYQYRWQHGDSMLRMEFERRGRGLRLIETDDWLVEAWIEGPALVFGRSYKACYRVRNKSGKPLTVTIRGRDDENISFALERSLSVQDEAVVEGRFSVGEIAEEHNDWRTHPGVGAEILINGKKALFKVGLLPKFPAVLKAVVLEQECYAGSSGFLWLNVENGFAEPARFSFLLPRADCVSLERQQLELDLEAGAKKAVPVAYTLKEPGHLTGAVRATAHPRGGGAIEFQATLTAVFAGPGAAFSGEDDESWFAVNGRYALTLQKSSNILEAGPRNGRPGSGVQFFRPELGLPYSVEFAKTRPAAVEHGVEKGVAYLKAVYLSRTHPGLEVERLVFLRADGIAWQEWRLRNTGSAAAADLHFRTMVRATLQGAVAPLAGQAVEARDGYGELLSNFPLSRFTENWLYSRGGGWGICWPRDVKPACVQGTLCFACALGDLLPGQEAVIEPVTVALGAFASWQEFRNFALGRAEAGAVSADSLAVLVNGGNPFVQGEYELTLADCKNVALAGRVQVSGREVAGSAPIEANAARLTLAAPAPGAVDLIRVEADTETVVLRRQVAVFGIGGAVRCRQQRQGDMDIVTADNGVLRFSAAAEFGPVLFSLQYRGREWLDSSFPAPRPCSWWHPWLGGCGLNIEGLSRHSLLKQPRTCDFAVREDSAGNRWQGLVLRVEVQEHEKLRGLQFSHYFLTLPGLAGLCTFVELEHSGLALAGAEFYHEVFLAPGGAVAGSWAEVVTPQGETVCYKQGSGFQSPGVNKAVYGSAGCRERLLAFSTADIVAYTNKDVMFAEIWHKFTLVPDRKTVTPPLFLFFTAEDIPVAALRPLTHTRFRQ